MNFASRGFACDSTGFLFYIRIDWTVVDLILQREIRRRFGRTLPASAVDRLLYTTYMCISTPWCWYRVTSLTSLQDVRSDGFLLVALKGCQCFILAALPVTIRYYWCATAYSIYHFAAADRIFLSEKAFSCLVVLWNEIWKVSCQWR